MSDHPRPTATKRHRLAAIAAAGVLALASLTAGASPASATDGPVPDFDETPFCLADIIAISCFMEGSATTTGEIVKWEWKYPGAFGNTATGQFPTLRFETTGVFEVTLTVTDDRGGTGRITKDTTVEISAE